MSQSLPLAFALLGLLSAVVLMILRSRRGAADAPGAGWWVLSVSALLFWGVAFAGGLKAQSKAQTAEALKALPVVNAHDFLTRGELLGQPVVIQGVAHCLAKNPEAPAALAVRSVLSGQDEKEGEESDYISVDQYGVEQDVVKFALDAPDSPLQVDSDAFRVVAEGPAETLTTRTQEYSPVAGGYLEEYNERRMIPCEASIALTGAFQKEGNGFQFVPLKKELSLLTDRPWTQMLATAERQSRRERTNFFFWLALAAAVGLLQGGVGLAKRAT